MSDELRLPVDQAAERAVLSACLHDPKAYPLAAAILTHEDWFAPAHAAVWAIYGKLVTEGITLDPSVLASRAAVSDPETRRLVTVQLVAELYTTNAIAASVEHYASIVFDRALRRRVIQASQRAAQRAVESEDAAEAADWAATEMDVVRQTQLAPPSTEVDIEDLLAENLLEDWAIPGLLAKGDRFILTAAEGLGKSMLLRQIATMAAAGIHPFDPRRSIRPLRVLVVDCENGRMLSQRKYRDIVARANQHGGTQGRLKIDVRPSGLNLLLQSDQSALLKTVERVRPELLIIGPIYRLHEDDPNDERPARKIAAVLDRARSIGGTALMTEAHSPHGDGAGGLSLRPFGASLWKRWPEFGFGLRLAPGSDMQLRECKFQAWRGPRDERQWPTALGAGGPWPWLPIVLPEEPQAPRGRRAA